LFTLPRLIGLARTRQFLYTGATWTAAQAVEQGVALMAVPDDEVDTEGIALAERLAAGPSEVMGLAKMLMLRSFESSLTEMMDYEDLAQSLAMSSPEFREGLAALLERRPADHAGAVRNGAYNDGLPAADQIPGA
jgi:2-(1,2-epoxy-1,2-dihydrophenyl)acetyl-CoA isomerase